MRRVIAMVAGVVLTGVLAGSVLAAQNQPNGYTLSASGWRLSPADVPAYQFAVSAQISGGHAIGTFRFGNATIDLKGSLTCGNVSGGTAVIGGRITSSTDPTFAGAYFLEWYIDGGPTVFGNWGPGQSSVVDVGGGTSTGVLENPYLPADFPVHCPTATGQALDWVISIDGLRTVIGSVSLKSTQNGQ